MNVIQGQLYTDEHLTIREPIHFEGCFFSGVVIDVYDHNLTFDDVCGYSDCIINWCVFINPGNFKPVFVEGDMGGTRPGINFKGPDNPYR